jgi:hypothetical protein
MAEVLDGTGTTSRSLDGKFYRIDWLSSSSTHDKYALSFCAKDAHRWCFACFQANRPASEYVPLLMAQDIRPHLAFCKTPAGNFGISLCGKLDYTASLASNKNVGLIKPRESFSALRLALSLTLNKRGEL